MDPMLVLRHGTGVGLLRVSTMACAAPGTGARASLPSRVSIPPSTAVVITSIVSTPSADTLPFPEFLRLLSRTDVETTALLRANAARYTFERLPFYDGAGWLRAIVMLPQRPVEFRYVYARGGTVALDRRLMPLGTPARVAAAGCG